ncbi:MAG: tetratricopeptide repeat protein, partial [Calditrichaeota bacterium]|nr:tetratricopeptide repeat protein [Calditrichota bacterium]
RRLEDNLREKDQTISILRAQIMSMEEEQRTAAESQPASRPMVVTAQPGMSDEEYRYQYQSGFDLFQNRQYREAMQVFESLLASRTDHSLSDNAQYWIGECYFAQSDFRAAVLAFEKVFTFENSNKNEDAQYKLGLCYMRLDDRKRAREELQSFLDNDAYTNTRLRSRAQDLLSQL